MQFISWLWDQLDDTGGLGKIAKVFWSDVNNGCAHALYTPAQWLKHFEEKHNDRKDLLIEMLLTSYGEYMLFIKKK